MTSLAGLGTFFLPNTVLGSPFSFNFDKKVRIALIGVGMRGQSNLDILAKRNDVEVVALADPNPIMMASAQKILAKNNKAKAKACHP